MTADATVEDQTPTTPAPEQPPQHDAPTIPTPASADTTTETPHADPDNRDDSDEGREGMPAAHLAVGGLSATAALLAGLYQVGGVWGLAAGATTITAGGGAMAYARWRRRRDDQPMRAARPRRERRAPREAATASTGRTGARTGGRSADRSGPWFGAPARRSHRTDRGTSAALRSFGRSGRAGRAADPASGPGTPRGTSAAGGHRRTGRRGAAGGGHGARHAAGTATGRAMHATRQGARRLRDVGRAVGRGARRWDAEMTAGTRELVNGAWRRRARRASADGARSAGAAGGRVHRAGGTRGARRAGAWADRRTGRRVSTAWAAARTATGFRHARRAALAARAGARRWDAQITAGVVALVAWLTAWWHRHRKPAKADAGTGQTAAQNTETAPETTSADTTESTTTAEEDTGPATTTTDAAPVAEPVRPAYARHRVYHRRTPSMSTFPLAAAAADMNAAAARYAPADMFVVARELDQLPEVPAYVALAIRTYTQRLQAEYPINSVVVDMIHQLYQAQAHVMKLAEEIGPMFRQVHADDLRREEAPRTNEPLWNV
ncbi:hypothetical protein OG589_39825 [Sphaerisporangium sp. NBC_01403]|uniref:hypothetical protein n=1 Tax=Sphaerisporangium sp. NBC_01403 TaxID=2903599 RepID=UPI003246ED33